MPCRAEIFQNLISKSNKSYPVEVDLEVVHEVLPIVGDAESRCVVVGQPLLPLLLRIEEHVAEEQLIGIGVFLRCVRIGMRLAVLLCGTAIGANHDGVLTELYGATLPVYHRAAHAAQPTLDVYRAILSVVERMQSDVVLFDVVQHVLVRPIEYRVDALHVVLGLFRSAIV